MIGGGQVHHARAAHVLEQRRIAPLQQSLEEHALAQPCLGRLQAVESAGEQHALDHDRAGQDQVRAGGLDARHARPLGRRQRGEPLHELVQRLAPDHRSLHAVGGKPGGALGGGGEVAHGAPDAHQPSRAR